ncbi:protein kinase, partial [Trypanosoma cruzi]
MSDVGDNDTNSSTERAPSGDQHNPLTTQQASITADEVWRNSGINALNPIQPQDVGERVHVSVPENPNREAVMHGDRETLFSQSQPQECNDQISFGMGSQPSSAAREGVRPDKQDTGGAEEAGAPPYSAHQRYANTTVGTPEVLHAAETGGDSGVMHFEEFNSSVRPPGTSVGSLPFFMRFRNPTLKGPQQKAHGSTNTPFSPVKPYGEPVITNRHHSPRLMRTFALSLR